jgi:sugar phosphate isomerase/epimerase
MTRPPLSVQLYSVRDLLATDTAGTIAALAQIGLTAVEPFGLPAVSDELREALREHDLSAPTAHAAVLSDLSGSLAAARSLGTTVLIEPYQPPERFTDRAGVAAVAAELSQAAERASGDGIAIGYHNHDGELRHAIGGVPALLLLAELTDPRVVFELDAYWAAVAGVDPVALAHSLGSRLIAVHAKDGDPAAGVDQQVPAGQGSVPLEAVLAAAPHARAIVEFDQLPAQGLAAIDASVRALRAMEAVQ